MDCSTFQNSEIDALYGELDAAASAAMAEHAATCGSCGARYERLRGTRGLVLSVAVEPVPDMFEARIMAAVDAGLAQNVRAPAAPAKAEGGAKIFKFMARPAFAVAATFVLVLGAAAILMQTNMAKRSSESSFAATPPSPMAVAASAATPSAMDQAGDPRAAATTAAAEPAVGSLALGAAPPPPAVMAPAPTSPAPSPLAFAENTPSPSKPSMRTGPMPPSHPASAPVAKPAKASPAADRELATAKGLATAGRCAEALPRLEALKGTHPEAELYAARCTSKTGGGCARFDAAAQSNAGTETGRRATLEGAKCFQAAGDVVAARKRFETAKSEGVGEASQALEALDHHGKPGAAGGGAGKATPKAPAPSPPAETVK